MTRFEKFKRDIKNTEIKTLIKKEIYWNKIYEAGKDVVRYDILRNHMPLTGDSDLDTIKEMLNKYDYKYISNRTMSEAFKKGSYFNNKIEIEIPKIDLE